MKSSLVGAMVLAGLLALLALTCWSLGTQEEFVAASGSTVGRAELIAQGKYLVDAGDCIACHTARGGVPFAGGRAIRTPFGVIFSSNITPDPDTGIGSWSADDLWRALHNGRGRDGRLLYPAFPYTNYTRVTRADADAIYAYLQSVAPVRHNNIGAALRFPYNLRPLLAVWRALYFRPGQWHDRTDRSASWNRGAYLTEGLGHCNACHANRNVLGATEVGSGLAGGQIPVMNWYAPSLQSDSEAGLKDWPLEDLVTLLHEGVSERAAIFGPMAEVVQQSLQHLSSADLTAIAAYLKESSQDATAVPSGPKGVDQAGAQNPAAGKEGERGRQIYREHCQDCHGEDGTGLAGVYPPLAGNRAIVMSSAVNPIRVVMLGGFAPVTQRNPRPFGMPPYGQALSGEQIADVVSYIRSAWGNRAAPVTSTDVDRYRGAPID